MSIQALSWSFEQEALTSSQKFVLVALANFAGETYLAYPSVQTICRITLQQDETVRNAIKSLIELGRIEDTGKRVGATQQVRVFRLLMPKPKTPENGELHSVKTPPKTPPKTPENGEQNRGTIEPLLPKGKRMRSPTIEEVKLQAVKIGLPEGEADKFFNYQMSKGWKVGNSPMQSWTHALTTWKLNSQIYGKNNGSTRSKGAFNSANRNTGTLNEGKASQYRGVGKVV